METFEEELQLPANHQGLIASRKDSDPYQYLTAGGVIDGQNVISHMTFGIRAM